MTTPDARSPFRRPRFIAAAIVIGVIFVAGAIVLATSLFSGGNDTADPTPGPVASSSSSPPADAADASICGLGQAAPNTFDCVLRYFAHEVSA